MKSSRLILVFFVLCISCVGKKQEAKNENSVNASVNSGPPAAAWQDGCGFAFEFESNYYLFALGSNDVVKFSILNDSTYQIIYPNHPIKIKKIRIDTYESKSWVSYGNSGLTNCIDKKNKEILFGPDRLKYKTLDKDMIEVRFPPKSTWHFTRISEREMFISNGKFKLYFTEYTGG